VNTAKEELQKQLLGKKDSSKSTPPQQTIQKTGDELKKGFNDMFKKKK
jgi:hypothetical protein